MRVKNAACYACIIIIGLLGAKAADAPPLTVNTDFVNYGKMQRDSLVQALEQIAASRMGIEQRVTEELSKNNEPTQAKLAAIVIAGCYRFEGLSPELARIIDFRDSDYNIAGAIPLWDSYPAEQALQRIGNPAIPSLLSNLAETKDNLIRELSASSLRIIMQSGPAKVALQEEIQRQTDAKNDAAVARLKAAMPLLDPPQ